VAKKLLWIILIIIIVIAGSFFIPKLMGNPVSLDLSQEYIYMAGGLVLMIGPWAWYIIRRKKDEDRD